jgi:hypothetical protein
MSGTLREAALERVRAMSAAIRFIVDDDSLNTRAEILDALYREQCAFGAEHSRLCRTAVEANR